MGLAAPSVFSDFYGIDTLPEVSFYKIDDEDSAFRHWYGEVTTSNVIAASAFEQNDCFTSMSFTTSALGNVLLNVSNGKTNDLIWAMDTSDYYVGHHELRGHLTGLNFSESFSPTLSPTPQPVAVTAAPTVTPAPTAFEVSGGTKKKSLGTFAVIMMSVAAAACAFV